MTQLRATKVKGFFRSSASGAFDQYLQDIQQQIQTKTAQIQELQKTIAKSLQQEKELEQIKKDAIELQAKLDMLKMVLPQEKETDEIFRDVQKLATMSGLQVSKVTPRPTIDHEVYTEYPIDLDVGGTFHNVGAFLDRIRQLPRIVSISGLRLQGRASQGEAAFVASVGATYTATTYVYKEEPIASAPPAAKPVK